MRLPSSPHTLLWTFLSYSLLTSAAFDLTKDDNLVLYWGQNSQGLAGSQKNLGAYCSAGDADLFMLAFVDIFFDPNTGLPGINFASSCSDGAVFPGTNLLQCPTIGKDINACQALGKTVMLSLGGAVGGYGFANDTQASDFADEIWNMFGNGNSKFRPFGSAVVDGFDLDIEGGTTTGYATFVTRMRQNFKIDGSKTYYMSAAPQCPYPDYYIGPAIMSSDFDFVNVQFYNNYCQLSGSSFNFDTWNTGAQTQSFNKNLKVFMGLPAAVGASSTGYVAPAIMGNEIAKLQATFPATFGGVMLWDASRGYANPVGSSNYVAVAKQYLLGGSSTVTSTAILATSASSPASIPSPPFLNTTTAPFLNTNTSMSSQMSTSMSSSSSTVWRTPSSSMSTSISVTSRGSLTSSSIVWWTEPTTPWWTPEPTSTISRTVSSPIASSSSPAIPVQPGSSTSSQSGAPLLPISSSSAIVPVQPGLSSSSAVIPVQPTPSSTSAPASAPSSSPGSGNCPVAGAACIVGSMGCNGNQFGLCDHNKWVLQPCGPGTTCNIGSQGPYCDWPLNIAANFCQINTFNFKRDAEYDGSIRMPIMLAHSFPMPHVPFLYGRSLNESTNLSLAEQRSLRSAARVDTVKVINSMSRTNSASVPIATKSSTSSDSDTVNNPTFIVTNSKAQSFSLQSSGTGVNGATQFGNLWTAASLTPNSELSAQNVGGPLNTSMTFMTAVATQGVNSTNFRGVLKAATTTRTPIGRSWQFTFTSNNPITYTERGNLSFDGTKYTIVSIEALEPPSSMAIYVGVWGNYLNSTNSTGPTKNSDVANGISLIKRASKLWQR